MRTPGQSVRRLVVGLLTMAALVATRPVESQSALVAGSLTGRVIVFDGAIPSPVRRARVTLTSSSGARLVTDSDTDGHYRFERVSPGAHAVDVVKAGFHVPANVSNGVAVAGTIPVQVDGGTTAMKDVVVLRAGAIEGRVVDTNGDPLVNIVVQARGVADTGPGLAAVIQPVRSDDRGRYRLHSLPPGTYVVEVAPLSRLAPAGAPRAALSGPRMYYPGVARIEDASPIVVGAQQEVVGIDLTFSAGAAPTGRAAITARIANGASSSSGTGRIAGRIRRALDGQPIAGAIVNVRPWYLQRGIGPVAIATDPLGRFAATALPAGSYSLTVSAHGFINRPYGSNDGASAGRRIELREGGSVELADMSMARTGAVEGRVFDEFGDPAPGVQVRLAGVEFIAGAARLVPRSSNILPRPTDDRGRFRIFDVPPGDYYVMALSGAFVPGSDAGGFAVTLYPGTRSGLDARTVSVKDGADTLGTDFAAVPARMVDVRGVVVMPDGTPVPSAYVGLMPASGGDVRMLLTRASATTAADGTFVVRNVPDGSYAVHVDVPQWQAGRASGGAQTPLFGASTIGVDGLVDVSHRIEVRPVATLRGRVVFNGPTPHPAVTDLHVNGAAMDFTSGPFEVRVRLPRWAEGNTFTIDGLVGRLVMRATVRPDVWVISRVTLAGRDVTDTPIDFSRGDVDDLEITFERTGASVTGRVTRGGEASQDYAVVIFPADAELRAWPSRFVALGEPDHEGTYRVTGLPPGQYLAAALPYAPGGTWRDPAVLRTLADRATPFALRDGETRSLTLELIQ
jgi:hypothetical protein